MKRTPALAVLGLFVLLASFFLPTAVNAQGDSAKNFNENKAQFMVPLGELIAEMEKDALVKITYSDAVKPYLEEKVVMAPWKFWDDPKLRLAYMLAPLDLSFEQVDEKTFQIIVPRYHVRPESEAKAHLDRLLRQYSNRELWEKLDALNNALKVEWNWVKGHAGVEYNEVCDQLCQTEIAKNR